MLTDEELAELDRLHAVAYSQVGRDHDRHTFLAYLTPRIPKLILSARKYAHLSELLRKAVVSAIERGPTEVVFGTSAAPQDDTEEKKSPLSIPKPEETKGENI